MSATNRGTERNAQDFYPTPAGSILPLLEEIDFSKVNSFLEPCFGEGHIYDLINVENKYFAELSLDKDYLDKELVLFPEEQVDLIITNPPFSLGLEFLEKSLQESKCVIYLLRLNFLGSQRRKKFWEENPLTHLFVLSKRPSFTGKGTDATEYAWFVWDKAGIIKKDKGIYVL